MTGLADFDYRRRPGPGLADLEDFRPRPAPESALARLQQPMRAARGLADFMSPRPAAGYGLSNLPLLDPDEVVTRYIPMRGTRRDWQRVDRGELVPALVGRDL